MARENGIKAALRTRGAAYGSWAQMHAPEICELIARTGLDFVIVDMEHGSFGIEGAVSMIRAVEAGGSTPVVRVPDAAKSTIMKVLDAGALGVIVPNLDSAEMAREIVSYARHAPAGVRGACPCTRACEANVMIGGLVETPRGIAEFDGIIAVPGLDFVAMGPFDLSQALGLNGDWKHPQVRATQEDLVRRAKAHGIEVMTATFDSDPAGLKRQTQEWTQLGARMFAVSGDRFMLAEGYGSIAAALRG